MTKTYAINPEKLPCALFLAGFTRGAQTTSDEVWRERVEARLERIQKDPAKIKLVILNTPEEDVISDLFLKYGWERVFNQGFNNGTNDLFIYKLGEVKGRVREHHDFNSYNMRAMIYRRKPNGYNSTVSIDVPVRPMSTPSCCGSKFLDADIGDTVNITDDLYQYYTGSWFVKGVEKGNNPSIIFLRHFIPPKNAAKFVTVENKPEPEVVELLNRYKYVEVYAGETHKLMFSSYHWQTTNTTKDMF